MLNDTACFPSKPVDNGAGAGDVIVEEPLRVDVRRTKWSDLSRRPEGAQQVKSSSRAVLNPWMVVLEEDSNQNRLL